MIEIIENLPENVIGFTAKGKVTGEDYENVLVPAVEEKLKKHGKIRLIYHLGDDFESFEAHALWEDAKVGLSHLTSWEKIAVITDKEWIKGATKVFGFLMNCEVKNFNDNQLQEAIEWISD